MMPFGNAPCWTGIAATLGGALLIAKRTWDHFGRGHVRAHTGYPEKDLTDFLFFLVPLILLIALLGLLRRQQPDNGHLTRTARRIAITGGTLQIISEFGEAWIPEGMTWGLTGALGLILISLSLVLFGAAAVRTRALGNWSALPLTLGLLIPVQILAVMLPYQLWGDEILSAQAGLTAVILFGLAWMLLGAGSKAVSALSPDLALM